MTVDLGTLAGRPVIVGAGLAGLVTALELAPTPCVLVTGGALGVDCASDWAQGGLAAAVGPDDSIAAHVADSLAAGAGLCDAEVTRSIVDAGPSVVEFLRDLGARFDTSGHGTLDLGLEGAHSRRRIVHAAGDGSGHEITRAAVEAVRSAGHVTVLEHTLARRILTRDGVTGIVLLTTEGAHTLRTGYVVLATGGAGALFTHTTNPSGSWGSGLALGLRAGAAVRDLEMVQFHPTALDVSLDPMPLVSEAVRGEGAHLVDDRGERVLADDLAPRDVVSRAVWARLDAGRRVFLDTPSAFGDSFARHFPTITAKCAAVGLDPAVDPLPVRPAAHYHMGGLLTDARGRTTVHGLWAVGEVGSTGLHGANRLASNSLLEAVAVGREVARDVRAHAPTTPALALVGSRQPHSGGAFGEPLPVWPGRPTQQDRLTLERRCGVLRDEARLDEAIDLLRPGAQARDARLVALLVAWSAYGRAESRGGHHRTDHPRCGAGGHTVFTLDEALAAIDDRHSRMRSA